MPDFKLRFERRTVGIIAIGIAVLGLFYLLVLGPLQGAAAKESTTLNQLNAQIATLQANSNVAAKAQLAAMYANDLQLDALLPTTISTAAEFTALPAQMTRAGLSIGSFTSATPTTAPGVAPAPSVLTVANVVQTQFSFAVTGSPSQIIAWLKVLYANKVMTTTNNMKFVAGNAALAGTASVKASASSLTGTIVVWTSTTPPITASATTPTTGKQSRHG